MKQIARVFFVPLTIIFVGCRSERAVFNCLPAAPALAAAPRLPPGSPSARPLASPAPMVTATNQRRPDRPAARPRRRWLVAAAAAGIPPPTPAADPAAVTPGQQRRRRLGRSASQQGGTRWSLPPLAKSWLALAGILLGLGLLIKLLFNTSFLVTLGVVTGLVVLGVAVLYVVLRNSKGFGWH